jgi:hypothetical protein
MRSALSMLMVLCLTLTAFGQTPGTVQYPTSQDTAATLFETADNAATVLTLSITSGATFANVTSTTKFPSTGSLVIDSEVIYYTGKTGTSFTGLLRGRVGTTAAAHASGAQVRAPILAAHHAAQSSAIIATQGKLGTGASTPSAGTVLKGTGAGSSAWGALEAGDIPSLDASKITTGTLSNSRTTATSANTPASIVARDANGDFIARNVIATNLSGNGAGITGLTGATGGVSNTGSTTIAADADANGVGKVSLQTGGVERVGVEADGTVSIPGGLAVYDRGGAVYNVKAYGALGNGSTNDTTAIQDLIDDVGTAGGGVIFFPPGTYKVSSLAVEANKVQLVGAGRGLSIIATNSTTANVITVGASTRRDDVAITGFSFVPSVTRSAGADIFAGNFLRLTLRGLQFSAPYDAIILGQAANQSYNPTVDDIQPANGISNGSKHVFLKLVNVLDGQFTNISIIALADSTGIWLEGGCEGHQFTNLHVATGDDVTVQTQGQGLLIENTIGGTPPRYNRFTNALFDLFYVNANIKQGQQTHFANCWFGGAKGPAGVIHGVTGAAVADSATGTTFSGGQAHNNNKNGMIVRGPGYLSLSGFNIVGNNRLMAASSVDTAGLVLDMDSGGSTTVMGCIIGKDMQGHPTQPQHYGIWITNRASDAYFTIDGNILINNTTGPVNNLLGLGGGHKFRDNLGYATESSGTGSVASGATTAVVTHSLSLTPAAADIQITPTNFSTNNVRYRVSAVSSTTFTVETSGDPGASGFAFSWAARVQ